MAARKKQKSNINLLPQEAFASSTTGRVLAWILSTFRILVIATEIVVMLAFLSRFYLDTRISDLNDEIQQRRGIIASYAATEKEFRSFQAKVDIYAEAIDKTPLAPIVKDMIAYLPADVSVESINYEDNQIRLELNTISERSISQYLANLTQMDNLNNTHLDQINQKPESNELNFTIVSEVPQESN